MVMLKKVQLKMAGTEILVQGASHAERSTSYHQLDVVTVASRPALFVLSQGQEKAECAVDEQKTFVQSKPEVYAEMTRFTEPDNSSSSESADLTDML